MLLLYKTMVSSLFQHCAEVWRPVLPTALVKFEAVPGPFFFHGFLRPILVKFEKFPF